jgi:hypothetical protein
VRIGACETIIKSSFSSGGKKNLKKYLGVLPVVTDYTREVRSSNASQALLLLRL